VQAWADWDIPSYIEQCRYWRKHPPAHRMIAAYLGIKADEPPSAPEGEQFDELIKTMGI
jgi:hypothetical protein